MHKAGQKFITMKCTVVNKNLQQRLEIYSCEYKFMTGNKDLSTLKATGISFDRLCKILARGVKLISRVVAYFGGGRSGKREL